MHNYAVQNYAVYVDMSNCYVWVIEGTETFFFKKKRRKEARISYLIQILFVLRNYSIFARSFFLLRAFVFQLQFSGIFNKEKCKKPKSAMRVGVYVRIYVRIVRLFSVIWLMESATNIWKSYVNNSSRSSLWHLIHSLHFALLFRNKKQRNGKWVRIYIFADRFGLFAVPFYA